MPETINNVQAQGEKMVEKFFIQHKFFNIYTLFINSILIMVKGKVKWFDKVKGYGFIQTVEENDVRDVFVHYSGIIGDGYRVLKEGQEVNFEIIDGNKGPQATQVTMGGNGEAPKED